MTTGQVGFSEALARAEAAILASAPGFNTLAAGQKRIAVLRQAIRDAGGEPVGPSFPNPADEPRVIDALETQLRNLQRAAEVAAPYRQVLIDSAAPELDISNDPRLLATEGGAPRQDPAPQRPAPRQPERRATRRESHPFPAIHDEEEQVMGQAAFRDPAPDLAMRERAVALQQELRELGFTPVIEGPIPLREAATSVIRLTNQLNAVLDPGREARIAPREFSSTSDAAALPPAPQAAAQPLAAETSAPPPGVDPRHAAYIATLQERVRAAGGRPEFTGPVTSENVFRAIQALQNQLERLRVIERARRELEESAAPTDIMDPRELEIMALRQAIRDYGDVPVVTGEVRPDSYTTTILALNRQLREIVSRPDNFDQHGFNTDPFSTDAQAIGGFNEDRTFITPRLSRGFDEQGESESANGEQRLDFSGFEVPYFFEYVQQLNETGKFREGDLASLALVMWANDPGINFADKQDQELYFLHTLAELTGSRPASDYDETTPIYDLSAEARDARLIEELLRGINAAFPGESGKIELDVNDYFSPPSGLLPGQLISDDVADNLPLPLRVFVKAALDFTNPLTLALLFVPGGAQVSLAKTLAAAFAGSLVSEIANEADLPPEAQIFASFVTEAAIKNPSGYLDTVESIFNKGSKAANAAGSALGSGSDVLLTVGRFTAREGVEIADDLILGKTFNEILFPRLTGTARAIKTSTGKVVDTSSTVARQLMAAAVRESTELASETKEFLATTLEKDMYTATLDFLNTVKGMDPRKQDAALLFAQLVDARSRASGFNPLEQARIDTSANALRQALEIGIQASENAEVPLGERGALPYFTFMPESAFDDIRQRIELGDDLTDIDREMAFRAVEKLAVGRGPNDAEFELLTRIFDGPEPGAFADTIERAVESKALIQSPDWTPRPPEREPRERTWIDIFKRPPFPTIQFPGAYGR